MEVIMTNEQKIRTAKTLFYHLFSKGPLKGRIFIHGVFFRGKKTHNGLNSFNGVVNGNIIKIVEQNPHKSSWCGKLRRDGYKCAWIFKNGGYVSFLIQIGDNIYILPAQEARSQVEDLLNRRHYRVF